MIIGQSFRRPKIRSHNEALQLAIRTANGMPGRPTRTVRLDRIAAPKSRITTSLPATEGDRT